MTEPIGVYGPVSYRVWRAVFNAVSMPVNTVLTLDVDELIAEVVSDGVDNSAALALSNECEY